MMQLYNTLSRKKENFKPTVDPRVTLYVCGITPYDTTHLGHAFTYTVFDVLYRFLEFQNYSVNYTQNVTDIDDDILKKAKENHRHSSESGNPALSDNWKVLGTYWTKKFLTDMKSLNNTPPTNYVKATEAIPTMIEIIKKLLIDGFAYERNGNVYFFVRKDREYGKLSGYTREQMIQLSRERGANPDDPMKIDPLDFILWQRSKNDEPFWSSPWGKGRPGWHIECSAMVYKYLGKKIDIHGGGSDLRFPHHESEIAQSEAFTEEKPFSQFFLHVGMVGFQGEKISKSLGNLIMISDLLKNYTPNTIRYLLLSHHYRAPWEYYDEQIRAAKKVMDAIESKLKQFSNSQENKNSKEEMKAFIEALSDDLDTPDALDILHKTIENRNTTGAKKMLDVLGFTI
jgi:L-cysteine:1D-myo-inositol 2-amino-2-deoxy-alpha-D-glucopyranoside ligase